MNDLHYFEIQVDDIGRAKDFYNKVFDWEFKLQEGLPIEYWRIKTANIDGGVLKRPVKSPEMHGGTNAFTCSMRVKSFDETADTILKNGGQVAMEKFAIPGVCWQGYFLDTEGNTFGIFDPNESAA